MTQPDERLARELLEAECLKAGCSFLVNRKTGELDDLGQAAIRAIIAALQSPALAEREAWRLIETAPKDGENFLAASDELAGGAPEVVSYEADNPEFCWGGEGGNFHRLRFTHWRPLPPGPGDIAADHLPQRGEAGDG